MTFEDEVRDALHRQAEAVEPSPDGWERIEERFRRPALARWQVTTLAAVAAAVVVLAAVVGVRVLGDDGKDTQQVAAGGPSTTFAGGDHTTTTADAEPSTTSAPPPSTSTAPPSTSSTTGSTTTTAPPSTDTTVPPTTSTTGPPATLVAPSDRLTWGSLGEIRAGRTVAEVEAATGVDLEESYAYEDRSCGFALSDRLPAGVWVMIADGVVQRVDVTGLDAEGNPIDQPIRDQEGLGVGSTEQEVLDAYGDDVTVEPHPYDENGHYLVVVPPGGELPALLMIMETDGERVTSLRSGYEEYVRYIEGCA